jgi:predicted transcriptional regulator of viral defense system
VVGVVNSRFVTLGRCKFFGWQPVLIEGQPIHIADLEKSLADALDHPEHCGGTAEVGKALATAVTERGADLERLTDYTGRMRNRAIFKRLGFLVERLSLPVEDELAERWRAALSAGYARLDPGRPAEGQLNSRWRVQVNAPDAELTGWMEM